MTKLPSSCFCCSGKLFTDCCKPFIDGENIPETAEQLMRSRYTAYCLGDVPYLKKTWFPLNCPPAITVDPAIHWIDLIVKNHEAGGEQDQNGVVEFVAKCKINGRAYQMHEVSRFKKSDSRWFYVDGINHPG